MPHVEFELKSVDGLALRGQGWEPDNNIKAVVCLVHGLGEHSERYRHVAEAFNQAGYALITFDLRGHGRSGGRRGHIRSYDTLMSDIAALMQQAEERYPGRPRFLYGHSLGGTLAISYAYRNKENIAGVIASAPLFQLSHGPSAGKTVALKLLHALRLEFAVSTGLEQAALSRDFHVVRLYQNDPLVHDHITPALAVAMIREGEWNLEHAATFPLPLLLMHGEADRITSVEASIEFAAHLAHRCSLKVWDGFYHELHNEPEQDQVLACVQGWMDIKCTEAG